MFSRHLLPALFLLGCVTSAFSKEDAAQRFLQGQSDVNAASLKGFTMRGKTEGDLNGDGLPDYAAIVVGELDGDGGREERLVVLAGVANGTYKMLSLSGSFCGAATNGKFYELSIANASLFVRGVWIAEAERYSSVTLQFRYNSNINDLQLIGEEEESRENGQEYKVSFNYLSKAVIYSREAGKRRKSIKEQLINAPLFRLQDFICFSQDALKPNVYIDEKFNVKRK